jgi:uncharacterized protein YodC (DUF2158 family)
MAEQFQDGDVVQLKSGGPEMTIKYYEPTMNSYECQWFSGNDVKSDWFAGSSLKKVSK